MTTYESRIHLVRGATKAVEAEDRAWFDGLPADQRTFLKEVCDSCQCPICERVLRFWKGDA